MNLPNVDRLSFDSKKHAYTLDGTKLLSGVTTVISETSSKSNLIQWAANMAVDYVKEHTLDNEAAYGEWGVIPEPHIIARPENLAKILESARTAHARKRDGAASKGTDTHALVENYINERIAKNPNLYIPAEIQPFHDWAITNGVEFIAAEQRLYSEEYGYAGTCDFVALIDGKLTIGDLKTFPKMWSADPKIQCGAYSLAFKELTGQQPQQSVIVRMCDPEDPRIKKYRGKPFDTYYSYAIEEDEEMFLLRLKMYRYNENFVSPKE
jgi:hypothetical protein